MKILIYPDLSEDGYYEEYYYWNDELFLPIYGLITIR